MPRYYVDNTPQEKNGTHAVHEEGCYWLSQISGTTYLGDLNSCHLAVVKAKSNYSKSNGCITCCFHCYRSY